MKTQKLVEFGNSPLFKQLSQSKDRKIYKAVIENALRRNPSSTFWKEALQFMEEDNLQQ